MSIPAIDLNLLLVLHTVLIERNVARAAKRLHVTPSAVSNALARLREALGDPLVTRRGRGIVPTPRAEEMAPAIARAVREIESALDTAPFEPATCSRLFTIAVADLGQITWVPDLVARLGEAMPLARLRVVGVDALVSLGDLGSSEIDVHVGVAGRSAGLFAEHLFEEPSVLVVRAGRRRIDQARLRHVRVEMIPGPARATTDAAVTVPSFTAAAEIVARTDLATRLPASFVAAKGRTLGLRVLPTSPTLPAVAAVAMSMCWHERTQSDAASRAFRALVRASATSR